jgi:hypothetical protein
MTEQSWVAVVSMGRTSPLCFGKFSPLGDPKRNPIQCKLIHTKEFCEKINGEVARF